MLIFGAFCGVVVVGRSRQRRREIKEYSGNLDKCEGQFPSSPLRKEVPGEEVVCMDGLTRDTGILICRRKDTMSSSL